eukprot:symbB.v1.2.019917.t1/scaffold1650.1/size135921/6
MPDVAIADEAEAADVGEAAAAEGPPFRIKALLVSGKEADLTLKAEATMTHLREAIESSLGLHRRGRGSAGFGPKGDE